MYEYRKCVPHAVLPRVEVCPEAARLTGELTEVIHRELVRVELVRSVRAADLGGADTMLALL